MSFNFRPGAFGSGSGSGSSKKSPSTPNRKGKSSLFSHAPSTTPAGPPPSYLTNKSTTPAGNPPRSSKIFGSSFNAAANTFGHRNSPARRGRGFAVPESSPPRAVYDEGEDGDDDEDAEGEVVDEGYGTQTGRSGQPAKVLSSIEDLESPRGLKRSRNGQVRDQVEGGAMAEIARSMARETGPAQLQEPDDVVLRTEEILSSLDDTIQDPRAGVGNEEATTHAAAQLTQLWTQHGDTTTKPGGIGPESTDPSVRATYIASLLLQLHTPHSTTSPVPLPLALLTWLEQTHHPFPDDFNTIHRHTPSPSAHESFWDILGSELLRAHFPRVIRLLTDAGFEHAITALDDGAARPGYRGKQLENVEEVVARFVHVLESAPAGDWDVRGPAWAMFRQRVRGAMRDLEAFAKGAGGQDAAQAVDDFEAEGEEEETNIFARAARMSSGFDSMAAASARAGSRVPWTIYENLKTMYGVLLGGDEILDFAQDWVESSLFFTIWWDGEDGAGGAGLNTSLRNSLRKSRGPGGAGAGTREIDVAPLTAYRRRLAQMVAALTTEIAEPSFQPDSLDPVQVALVCVMEDRVEAVVELLRAWDPSVAVAVVELAALGGWLPLARPSSRGLLMRGFSSEDLMVLSQGPDGARMRSAMGESVDRDAVLVDYAELVAQRDVFRSTDGRVEKEGWEVAVAVLRRLDEKEVARGKIEEILETLPLGDEVRIDKVLGLCSAMGLVEQARGVAERYADTLATTTSSSSDNTTPASTPYGLALIYYARAHATRKLHSTISLLITLSLLHSAALPVQQTQDTHLTSLLSKDRALLAQLARADPEAAALLSRHLSGYATLRRFYELRDDTHPGHLRPVERNREAAKALLAVIESGADCIRGGLLDPDVAATAVVPVEGLLVLLGEALPFLLPGASSTQQQYQQRSVLGKQGVFTLLRVLEDLDTAPARVKEGAVDVVQGALRAFRAEHGGEKGGEAMVLSGSSWDLLASSWEMLGSREGNGEAVVRGWDWRGGLDAVVGDKVEGKEVLMLLRTALAREVAGGFGGGLGW